MLYPPRRTRRGHEYAYSFSGELISSLRQIPGQGRSRYSHAAPSARRLDDFLTPAGGAGRQYCAWVNFVVCPYDDTQLRAVRGPSGPARPLLMTCPACQKQFRLSGGEAVEVAPPGDDSQI